ncbi:class I SAM-dependent methyltransferase [Dactylosporangium matsuzakiense]|uniref:class I SAM-dependent methyltransferase n=1 Tax=Dactylosporangium matsuzakiense TaxID=53360 RepID=UPI0022F32755|nr:class I SAM-dependent methyltransferase [Dactylosporangium matsuzakiense]
MGGRLPPAGPGVGNWRVSKEPRSYSLVVSDANDYVKLRATFDEDAVRYDRARPRYPAQMFDDLAAGGAAPGAGVLEIGCGTGQATVSLAERGYRIVAVELGAELAAVARRNLAGFDAVEIVTGAFEAWPLPGEPFDVVFAATAFHWIDPAVRVSKSADALRPSGLLATVATHHIAGGTWTEAFFAQIQQCYERFDPSTPPGLRLQTARDIVEDDRELTASGRFGPAKFYRYEWELSYSTADYLDVLLTYSSHRALPDGQRSALLDCVARLIDVDHGGRVVKRYLTELRIAQRVR